MTTRWNRKGFTIVELLVTLAVSGTLVALLTRGYIVQKRSAEGEASLRELNMKSQLAMNRIKTIVRNAGLGSERNLTQLSGTVDGANQSFGDVFTVTSRDDGPDALTVVTGHPARTTVKCNQDTPDTCTDAEKCTADAGTCQSSTVHLATADDLEHFDAANRRYVFIAPSLRNEYREIVSLLDDQIVLDEVVTVHHNDPVYRVAAHTIALDRDGDGATLDVDGDGSIADSDPDPGGSESPDLHIYDNLENPADEGDHKLVEGVEDLQFQFLLKDGTGATDWSTWHDTPAVNQLDDIRAVRIWLLVRSSEPDARHEDTHEAGSVPKAYQVADHIIQLDTNDENGFDSPFDHRYHRLHTVDTVMVRNRNL